MSKMYEEVTVTTKKGTVTISGHVLDAVIMIATDHVKESGEDYNVTMDDVVMIATDHVKESGEDYNVTMDDVVKVGEQILGVIWED